MIISGNGLEIELESKAKNVLINASANLERKDLSGQNSASDSANAGNKPKKISISMQIPLKHADHLTHLLKLAEAIHDDGTPFVYSVADLLCKTMQIREIIFAGRLSAKLNESLLVFDVSFSLQEQKSVAEKREENRIEKTKTDDTIAGSPTKINDAIKQVTM